MSKKLDFSKFKKVEGTARYTVFQDESGNLLRLNHKTIDNQHAKDLQKLPFQKFNKGGMVEANLKENYSKARKKSKESRKERIREKLQKKIGYADGTERPLKKNKATPELMEQMQQMGFVDEQGRPTAPVSAGPEPIEGAGPQSAVLPDSMERALEESDKSLAELSSPPPTAQSQLQSPTGQVLPPTDTTVRMDPAAQLDAAVREQEGLAKNMEAAAKAYAGAEVKIRNAAMESVKELDRERNKVREQIQGLSGDLKKLKDARLEPQSIWGEGDSTPRKLAVGISLLLGSFSRSGQNSGLKALNDIVERDLKVQEKNLNNQRNVLGYNIDMLKDREEGIRLRRAQHYDYLAGQLENKATKFQGTQAGINAKMAAQEFSMKAAQEKAEIEERQATKNLAQLKQLASLDEEQEKEQLRQRTQLIESEDTLGKLNESLFILDDAETMLGNRAVGYSGIIGANLNPSSPGGRLKTRLETLKARFGFDKLAQLRKMSPTGGALGNVSDRENENLQKSVANLEQFQDARDLRRTLKQIQKSYNTIIKNIKLGRKPTIQNRPSPNPSALGFRKR